MRTIHERLRPAAACAALLLTTAPPAAAQTDTMNVPQPPAAELAVFEPFFGKWEHSGDTYMGTGPWRGTLEMRPAIEGWYVEGVIRTRYGPIDRELRMLTTWDAELGRYRTWRFETTPQSPPGTVEGEGRIEDGEYITEWKNSRGPNGERGTFRNRLWLEGPDVLVIRSEAEPEGGALVPLGEWRFRRIGTAPAGTAGSPSGPRAAQPLALTNVTVIDVRDGTRHAGRTVVVDGTRIAVVGRSGDVAIPDGALVVDARGRFLIPGLWDMHVHSAQSADVALPIYLALGMTGVRNMHTSADTALELVAAIKRRIADGTLRGPRFIANGAIVDGPMPVHRGSVVLGTPAAARAVVDSLAAAGADFIKVYDKLPREVFLAVAEQAKRRGIPVVGHVPTAVGAELAADAGQRGIEHADALNFECSAHGDSIRADLLAHPASSYEDFLRRHETLMRGWSVERCAPAIAAMRRNGTWFTPNLVWLWAATHPDSVLADPRALAVLGPERMRRWEAAVRETPGWRRDLEAAMLEAGMELVRALHRAGVPLLAGTDAPNLLTVPGYSLHRELEVLVSVGLTPLEALQTATLNPARFLEAEDSLGTVAPGKLADLLLLDADPLEDIRNTQRIRAVIANGRYYDRAALDRILDGVAAAGS